MCWKNVSVYGFFHILRKCIFTNASVPYSKLQQPRWNVLKICFPQDRKGGVAMICSIKNKSKNMKMT